MNARDFPNQRRLTASESQEHTSGQDHPQPRKFPARERFCQKYFRPDRGPDVAERHHGEQQVQVAVPHARMKNTDEIRYPPIPTANGQLVTSDLSFFRGVSRPPCPTAPKFPMNDPTATHTIEEIGVLTCGSLFPESPHRP